MELNLFFLASLLQYTSIDRCVLFMRAKKKKFILPVIKIIPLAPFFFILLSMPLSLSQSLASHL